MCFIKPLWKSCIFVKTLSFRKQKPNSAIHIITHESYLASKDALSPLLFPGPLALPSLLSPETVVMNSSFSRQRVVAGPTSLGIAPRASTILAEAMIEATVDVGYLVTVLFLLHH